MLFAPGYDEKALAILTGKPDIRILQNDERRQINPGEHDDKHVMGGILVQDKDGEIEERDAMTVATKHPPSEQEWGDLIFAFRVAKHVKSNAIVIAKDLATVGVGAGQMSRVDPGSPSRRPRRTRAPWSDRTPSIRYRMPSTWPSTPVSRRSCSRAGRRATRQRSRPATAWRRMVFTGRRHFLH